VNGEEEGNLYGGVPYPDPPFEFEWDGVSKYEWCPDGVERGLDRKAPWPPADG